MVNQITDINAIMAQKAESEAQEKVANLFLKCWGRFEELYQDRKNEDSGEYISQAKVRSMYDISHQTLKRLEQAGLKRYKLPFENSRRVFYKRSEFEACFVVVGDEDE